MKMLLMRTLRWSNLILASDSGLPLDPNKKQQLCLYSIHYHMRLSA